MQMLVMQLKEECATLIQNGASQVKLLSTVSKGKIISLIFN